MTRIEFDPPIDPRMGCRHCGDPIVAVAYLPLPGIENGGLKSYQWTHAHGNTVCKPKTTAAPFDHHQATVAIQARVAARRAAEDDEAALAEARANVAERRSSLWTQR